MSPYIYIYFKNQKIIKVKTASALEAAQLEKANTVKQLRKEHEASVAKVTPQKFFSDQFQWSLKYLCEPFLFFCFLLIFFKPQNNITHTPTHNINNKLPDGI
jgi:hypothetical protein